MERRARGVVKLGVALVLSLIIGAAVVFALNGPDSGVVADSVTILKSQGVTCGSCAGRIEKALKEKAGVASVEVAVDNGGVIVAHDAKIISPGMLAETVTAQGYESRVVRNFSAEEYRDLTENGALSRPSAKSGGCGCCNKNKN